MSVRVLGQDDIHSMGLIKSLHHLDSIAQRAREEHGVVDGTPSQQPSLIAMEVPDASTWVRDELRSYWACRSGSRRGAAHGPPPGHVEEGLVVGCYG
jgi:hypothetical protein